MEQIYLTEINIQKVRHLQNIKIKLSENEKKHLVLTGINGCGKTSVLRAINRVIGVHGRGFAGSDWKEIDLDLDFDFAGVKTKSNLLNSIKGKDLYKLYEEGKFISIYFPADRTFTMKKSKSVEAIDMDKIEITAEKMNTSFGQLLVYLYVEKLFAREIGDEKKIEDTEKWFEWLKNVLRDLFDNPQLILKPSLEDMCFKIKLPDREEFGLDEMASGYEALFNIFSEIVIRMERQAHLKYDLPGIVLIDEIDLHLHMAWQKRIFPFLAKTFPNIQFIVTTHSPFVLNHLENAVIYDLENHILVERGLNDVPYDGIVEGYFKVDKLSGTLREKFEKYKDLVLKKELSDENLTEIAELELYLDEIPDYLAIGIATEYKRLKLEFMNREDADG